MEVRPDTNTVVVAGEERYLRPQAMQVLTYLLQRPGEVVATEALNREIWSDIALTNDALGKCIAEIQKAFGDTSRRPKFIRTVPKTGYCFIGPVHEFLELPAPATGAGAAADLARSRRRWAVAAVAVAMVAGLALAANCLGRT